MSHHLPPEFSALDSYTREWALTNEKDRHDHLVSLSIDQLKLFYEAMLPQMDAITKYLNQFSLDAMPADAKLLFDMAMTFMESAHPIDLHWKTTDIEDKVPAERFQFYPPSTV